MNKEFVYDFRIPDTINTHSHIPPSFLIWRFRRLFGSFNNSTAEAGTLSKDFLLIDEQTTSNYRKLPPSLILWSMAQNTFQLPSWTIITRLVILYGHPLISESVFLCPTSWLARARPGPPESPDSLHFFGGDYLELNYRRHKPMEQENRTCWAAYIDHPSSCRVVGSLTRLERDKSGRRRTL